MSKPSLAAPFDALERDIIDTMHAGNGGEYPQSHSDWQWCVRALLKMFDVKRLPIAREVPVKPDATEGGAS